jgi:hypothetical protein
MTSTSNDKDNNITTDGCRDADSISPSGDNEYPLLLKNIGRFKYLQWTLLSQSNNLSKYKLVQFSTIGDGSCFVHAILLSYSKLYRALNIQEKMEYVKNIRQEAANLLDSVYNELGKGELSKMGLNDNEFTLSYLKGKLASKTAIGHEFIEYLSNYFNRDIYILDQKTQDVYQLTDERIHQSRPSIVIVYCNNHYELIGCEIDGKIHTYWSSTSSLIKYLQERLKNIRSSKK